MLLGDFRERRGKGEYDNDSLREGNVVSIGSKKMSGHGCFGSRLRSNKMGTGKGEGAYFPYGLAVFLSHSLHIRVLLIQPAGGGEGSRA
jgi:hypothetical protein